jgi:IS4 transposase
MVAITQPQRKFLSALFSTLLVVRRRANFLNLARHSHLSEKTYRRHYRRRFDFLAFNQRAVEQAVAPAATPVFAQDASFVPKSGTHTYGLDRFWNGCASRVERGLEVSVIALLDVERECAYPLSAQQTRAGADQTTDNTETRIDDYLRHLQQTAPAFAPYVSIGVFDGFYAKRKFIDGVCALGFTAVSKLRLDANLRYLYTGTHTGRGRPKRFDGKVHLCDLSRFTAVETSDTAITLYTAVVNHVTLQRDVRLVVVVNSRDAARPRYALLFATNTELAAADIYRYYKARFHIEFVFRDAKQFAGFSECQARDKEALHFHFNTALATVNLTRLAAQERNGEPAPHVFSMASWKQRAFNEHWLNLIISKLALDPMAVKSHPQYEYLRNYGVIAA